MKYISRSEQETIDIARDFAGGINAPCLIGLVGELGTGKTVFTRGIVEGLGGDSAVVSSPTFSLMNIYPVKQGRVCHIDAYRLKDESEFLSLGIYDMMDEAGHIILVEWIDRFPEILNEADYIIKFLYEGDNRGIDIVRQRGDE